MNKLPELQDKGHNKRLPTHTDSQRFRKLLCKKKKRRSKSERRGEGERCITTWLTKDVSKPRAAMSVVTKIGTSPRANFK